jgi:hypothetical protein
MGKRKKQYLNIISKSVEFPLQAAANFDSPEDGVP